MKPLATRHCDLKFGATPNMYLYKYKTKGQLISEDFFLSSDTLKTTTFFYKFLPQPLKSG